MTTSEAAYAASLDNADLETRLRERDSNARCYARAVLDGDNKTAEMLLARFAIADLSVLDR